MGLPELPKDPHPTNQESGDHSAVGHCQEAVTYCRVQSGRIKGVPLEGQYLHIFHRAVPEAAKKTRPKELACPVIRPPYYKEAARFYLQWTNGAPNQSVLSCHSDSTSGVPPGHLLSLGKTKCQTLANSTWTSVQKK